MKFYCVFMGLCLSAPVQAFEWSEIWLNDYQKAQKLLKDNPAEAAVVFQDPEWQGVANYNAGNYQGAADSFAESSAGASGYNLGNALAKAGELEKSLESYDSLLANPDLPESLRDDTRFNRDLVEKLMQQQEQQKQEQQQESDENSDESEDSQESDSNNSEDSQSSDQEGQQKENQKDSEQSESGQEEQDKQKSEHEKEQQANDEQEGHKEEPQQTEQAKANHDQPMTEDQQATEQWLRQIPDDPAGLLRRKLVQSHRSKYPQVQNGGQAW